MGVPLTTQKAQYLPLDGHVTNSFLGGRRELFDQPPSHTRNPKEAKKQGSFRIHPETPETPWFALQGNPLNQLAKEIHYF